MLSRFEAELAQYQRIAAENTDWLPPYRQQLGRTFPFEDELADKRQELDALEASLAATAADSGGEDDFLDLDLDFG